MGTLGSSGRSSRRTGAAGEEGQEGRPRKPQSPQSSTAPSRSERASRAPTLAPRPLGQLQRNAREQEQARGVCGGNYPTRERGPQGQIPRRPAGGVAVWFTGVTEMPTCPSSPVQASQAALGQHTTRSPSSGTRLHLPGDTSEAALRGATDRGDGQTGPGRTGGQPKPPSPRMVMITEQSSHACQVISVPGAQGPQSPGSPGPDGYPLPGAGNGR